VTVPQKYREIRTRSCPDCYLCGTRGKLLYRGLRDHVLGVPGEWCVLKCPECGLLWLDPQPIHEDIGMTYQDYQTHGIVNVEGRRFSSTRKAVASTVLTRYYGYEQTSEQHDLNMLGTILSYIPLVREVEGMDVMQLCASDRGSLLDVGCGNGHFLSKMQTLGWQVQGVEPDEQAANIAQKVYNLKVLVGMLTDARFPDDSFDVVTLSHVIEHADDPIYLLQECKRVLRSGGRLVLTTPNTESLGHRIFQGCWRGLEPPRHLFLFSLEVLRSCVQKVGFDTITMRSTVRMGWSLYTASRFIRKASKSAPSHGQRQENKVIKLEGYLFEIAEEIARLVFPGCGEEIYFVGVRPDGSR
jgi:SAM-dependent methyltransferase